MDLSSFYFLCGPPVQLVDIYPGYSVRYRPDRIRLGFTIARDVCKLPIAWSMGGDGFVVATAIVFSASGVLRIERATERTDPAFRELQIRNIKRHCVAPALVKA